MAFEHKRLDVSFTLANGVFQGGGNTATISGARVTANVEIPGGAQSATAEIAVFGLPMSMMNQLSTVGTQMNLIGKNKVTLLAGSDEKGVKKIFTGTIVNAWVDGRSQPNVAFRVKAIVSQDTSIKPVAPITVKGKADVGSLFGQVAQNMGLSLENNGVNIKVMNPYLHGSPRSQLHQLAQMAGIEAYIENEETLAIWKPGTPRKGSGLTISKSTGMVGYPSFNQGAIVVTTEYNPDTKFGTTMSVTSDLKPACGTWQINNVYLELEARVPNGKWFAVLTGTLVGQADAPSNE